MTISNEPAIELVGVTKRFGRTTVVDDLTLRVPRGTTLGLIGPNGAGKSTTIKMLMGVLSMTSGFGRVLGMDIAADATAIKRSVGYVAESPQMYRWMRVNELIAFTRTFFPTWNDAVCRRLLDLFALDRDKKIRHLSKGMLAKVSLVLAISHEPDVLILDEPMSGLDPLAREEFLGSVLRTLCDRHCTILFSSHTFSDVQRMADNIAMLDQGKLLIHCPQDELLASARRIRAVLCDDSHPRWQPEQTIWQRVEQREWLLTVYPFSTELLEWLEAGNSLHRIEVMEVGLEDLFKDYLKGRRAGE